MELKNIYKDTQSLLKGFKEKRDLRSKFGGRELGKECMIKKDITCNRKQSEQDEDFGGIM